MEAQFTVSMRQLKMQTREYFSLKDCDLVLRLSEKDQKVAADRIAASLTKFDEQLTFAREPLKQFIKQQKSAWSKQLSCFSLQISQLI